jgi:hypothetical protein
MLLFVTPCLAHHSFAMFDQTKTMTLQGTVKELQWTNPHCYLQVLVASRNATAEWSIEMHSPLSMYRFGWKPGSFKPGDKVTVVLNPLKDGANGGRLLSAIDANGRTLGTLRQPTTGRPQT